MINDVHKVITEIKILAVSTVQEWLKDNMMLHAAGLAFYTIFSLAPLLVLIIALTGFFFGEQAAAGQISYYMEEFVGAELAKAVEGIVANVSQGGREGITATVLSTGILLFAATTVLTQLKESLNIVWNVDPSLRQPVKMFFINRLLGVLLILIFAAALVTTFILSTIISFITPLLDDFIPGGLGFYSFLNSLSFLLISTLLFTLIYKLLPDVNVQWRDVVVGAFVTSLLFLLGRFVVSMYLNNAATTSTYGAAGSFVIFLIWVYYNVMVIFMGAEFTQVFAKRYGGEVRPGRYLRKVKKQPSPEVQPET